MKRLDPNSIVLGRRPSPFDLCRAYAYPNTVPMIYPLPRSRRLVVFLVSYSPKYAVLPAAIYDAEGNLERIPPIGLSASLRKDLPFPYEVTPERPLRTARDPQELGISWALRYLDDDPVTLH